MKVAGLDLAGTDKKASGLCIMDEDLVAVTYLPKTNEEIVDILLKEKPSTVGIDAPLSLPSGRKSIDERNEHHFRKCDLELRNLGIKFFPITLGPMRTLTKRGILLKKILEKKGFEVIEVYPGGAQDLLKIPRKKDLEGLRRGLEKLGIKMPKKQLNHDELDAITAAYVTFLYKKGEYLALGDEKEGLIIMPRPKS